jgi:hypothetical protein
MKHLTNINDIEQTIEDNRLCLFYIKAPDCGVCNVMLEKVEQITTDYPAIASFPIHTICLALPTKERTSL